MLKEPKNIDFYTTGRELTQEDFLRISEWIKKQKLKAARSKSKASKSKAPMSK